MSKEYSLKIKDIKLFSEKGNKFDKTLFSNNLGKILIIISELITNIMKENT